MAEYTPAAETNVPRDFGLRAGRGVAAAVCLLVMLLVIVQPGWAIVTSDDPNSPHHLVSPGSPYDMVGYFPNLVGGASGVLIGPRHVLTAKHVVKFEPDPTDIIFRLDLPGGAAEYHVRELFMHSSADLALLALVENTGLVGYGLYRGSGELGQTAAIVGYGESGTGLTGGSPPRGTSRIAWNVIDRTTVPGHANVLGYDFDQWDGGNDGPWGDDSLGETLEGSLGLGDSGGGLFVELDSVPLLAGIHFEVIPSGGSVGLYGDCALGVRLRQYLNWISNQVPGDANWDGRVDGADYTVWADHYGDTGVPLWLSGGYAFGNFNNDSTVDGADYTLWADNYLFGTGGDVGGGRSVMLPEPAAVVLIGLGGIALLRRR